MGSPNDAKQGTIRKSDTSALFLLPPWELQPHPIKDNLFDYVGSDTSNLCIVGTDEIFTRPWWSKSHHKVPLAPKPSQCGIDFGLKLILLTEIYPVQNWSLAMLQEPSSRPQPQYWIKLLYPWVRDFYPVLGCSSPPS